MSTMLQIAAMKLRRGAAPNWLRRGIDEFQPEAVLTAGIAGAWIQAAGLAHNRRIPLHMIVHDDHHYAYFWLPQLKDFGERLFQRAYRQAVSRLCVSEPMREEYLRRFGVDGQVLMPSRGCDSVCFSEPRSDIARKVNCLNVVYAGSISGHGFEVMESIAAEFARRGHQLVLYTPSQPPPSLNFSHLVLRPPIASAELIDQLHREADLLLLWTDSSESIREVVRTLFPSKMVDYTAAAVPIVVVAPQDACIVRYLQDRPELAFLVKDDCPEAVATAVDTLAQNPELRRSLAVAATEVGQRDFSWETAWRIFANALAKK